MAKPSEPARRTPSRKQVIARLWRSAERQVAEIEGRMTRLDEDHQALEREAKTLAIIAKTVRDLVAIDGEAALAAPTRRKGAAPSHGSMHDGGDVRDIGAFRAELARRLDELRRERGGDETP